MSDLISAATPDEKIYWVCILTHWIISCLKSRILNFAYCFRSMNISISSFSKRDRSLTSWLRLIRTWTAPKCTCCSASLKIEVIGKSSLIESVYATSHEFPCKDLLPNQTYLLTNSSFQPYRRLQYSLHLLSPLHLSSTRLRGNL